MALSSRLTARRLALLSALGALPLCQSPARAQTLAHDYWINLQAYYPKIDTNVRATARTEDTIGTDIDMEQDLDLDPEDILPAVSIGARWGHVILTSEFFKLKRSGTVLLDREIEFDAATYPASAEIRSGFSSDIYRLTVGYAIIQKPNLEIGAAIGLHATDFDVFLEGEASVGGETLEAATRRKKVFAPLPTLGLFATWRLAPRLEATGRIDYLSLDIGDYDGELVNVQAGLNYQVFDNVSLGLAYRYVDYKVGVDKDDWSGRMHYKLNGPALVLQAAF